MMLTAERLGTPVRFIRRLRTEGRIPVVKLGKHIRIDSTDLDNFIIASRQEAWNGTQRGGPAGPTNRCCGRPFSRSSLSMTVRGVDFDLARRALPAISAEPWSSDERVLVEVAASSWDSGRVDLGYIASARGGRLTAKDRSPQLPERTIRKPPTKADL